MRFGIPLNYNIPMNSNNPPNALIACKSPYLQQHAYNPVEWQPWAESAWTQAKSQNKLVLVSIGYSTCHWCHVMERESFEDHQTAEIMNLALINIKVDREERPDIDMVYMDACQLMTGRGGWPLNVICLPDGRPIYAGTYFQKPQWQQIVLQLSTQYQSDPDKFLEYADKFMEELNKMNAQPKVLGDLHISKMMAGEIFAKYAEDIDWEEGAKKRAPKFPVPIQFEYTFDYFLASNDPTAKDYLQLSLLKMANGGIYDHVRGGFYRYSTDAKWFAPHFEKMLYDNAQLIGLYSRAFAWSQADIFKQVAEQTIDFCIRELKNPQGGFYSGLDADSDGIEGRYYTFTSQELKEILNAKELEWLTHWSDIREDGNWEHELNIIHVNKAPLQVLEDVKITAEEFHTLKFSVLGKLFNAQATRNRPSLDYKIIASWNGLMLKGLCQAGKFLNAHYIQEAIELGSWIKDTLIKDNIIYRIHAQGETYTEGFLEDYASVSLGFIELYKTTLDVKWLTIAQELADRAVALFYNKDQGTFSFTSSEAENLIIKKSDSTDDVIPGSNTLMAEVLYFLFTHTSNLEYKGIFDTLIKPMAQHIEKFPGWYSGWARLHNMLTYGDAHIIIRGNLPIPENQKFAHYPSWMSITKENSGQEGYYICSGDRCFEPVQTWEQVEELLDELFSID